MAQGRKKLKGVAPIERNPSEYHDTEHISLNELCYFVGGPYSPCHPGTALKAVKRGELPQPIKFGALHRWHVGKLRKALARMAQAAE
jgi:hypothetical protein